MKRDTQPGADTDFELIERLSAESLEKIYRREYGCDVSPYLEEVLEYREDRASGLRYFYPARAGRPEFYEKLDAFDWYYQGTKAEYARARGFTAGQSVLDIGCGEGHFALHADAATYVGLETNASAVKAGRSKGRDIREQSLHSFSAENPRAFDVACLFQVLEHVENPTEFLAEAGKCVKPGGLVFVSVPSENSFVGQAVNNVLNMPPHHLTRWSNEALVNLADSLGYRAQTPFHEVLDRIHVRWYLVVRLRWLMARLTRSPDRLIDKTPWDKRMTRIAELMAPWLKPVIYPFRRWIRGHTVSIVMKVNL